MTVSVVTQNIAPTAKFENKPIFKICTNKMNVRSLFHDIKQKYLQFKSLAAGKTSLAKEKIHPCLLCLQ